jgi:transposase
VQQQQLGHRGIKHDPLYRIRNPLRAGAERLSARQIERIEAGLQAGDPTFEVTVAWRCYQQLRSAFGASSLLEGRAIAVKVLDSFPTGPIPEIARLGRTLNAWKQQFLAYFTTQRANNGGTEAINGIIELHRRIARGSTNPANYRLRMILAAGKLTPPESPMSRITPQVVGTSRRARGVRNAMCRPERQSTFQLIDCVLWIGY